ncbi:MAG: tetratricopeptide repeat protein, partial [Kiritimatiellae bacterium]|nr:tetratricopeptide repeat protein [Kiritimatiellia bacterium]
MTFVAVLATATHLSPSSLMEPYGRLPVATSAFAAVLCGYLASWWWYQRKSPIALVSGGIFAFVLVVTCGWNLFTFDGDKGAFADAVARRIVKDMGDRRWFVSDGIMDSHVKLVASEEGKTVHVVSLSRDLDEKYLTRLSEVVRAEGLAGERNNELQLSLMLGVLPFLQDWFASDPVAAKQVVIWGAPDIWYSANVSPIPEFLFFGADESRVPDWTAWAEFDKILAAPKGWGSYRDRVVANPVDRMRYSLRRHIGFVANNRGVWLQDKHRDDEAWKMYELVLNSIDHDNICAIFNEVGMVGSKHPQAVAKQRDLERMLRSAVDDANRRYILWRLGAFYGYIRNPDIFIRLGHAWARSGRPGDALSQIRRAIDFVPTDKRAVLLNMMASLYASENKQRQSREIYEKILLKDAKDHDALIGMMRLELLNGNSAKAIEYLKRAAESSGDGKRAKIELAMVAMMKNEIADAKDLIRKATDADPKDLQCWSLLAAATIQQIDAEKDAAKRSELQKELENTILPTMEKLAGGV